MLAVIRGVSSRFCKILYIQRKGGVTQRNAAHIIISNFICCYFAVKKIVAFLQYNTLLMANMGYSCFFCRGGGVVVASQNAAVFLVLLDA